MILKNVSYFQEKENLTEKKEVILFIDCKKCPEKEENLIGNKHCLYCLFYNLFLKFKVMDELSTISCIKLISNFSFTFS